MSSVAPYCHDEIVPIAAVGRDGTLDCPVTVVKPDPEIRPFLSSNRGAATFGALYGQSLDQMGHLDRASISLTSH